MVFSICTICSISSLFDVEGLILTQGYTVTGCKQTDNLVPLEKNSSGQSPRNQYEGTRFQQEERPNLATLFSKMHRFKTKLVQVQENIWKTGAVKERKTNKCKLTQNNIGSQSNFWAPQAGKLQVSISSSLSKSTASIHLQCTFTEAERLDRYMSQAHLASE